MNQAAIDCLVLGRETTASLISGNVLFWEDYAYICGWTQFLATSARNPSLIVSCLRLTKNFLCLTLLLLESHRRLAVPSTHFLGSRRWAHPGCHIGKKENRH